MYISPQGQLTNYSSHVKMIVVEVAGDQNMMRISEAKENRRAGLMKHLNDMPPFEKLRRAFVTGRPVEVKHTAVSAVAAAQDALARLIAKIAELGLTKVQPEVGIVVFSRALGGKTVSVTMDAKASAQTVADIAEHTEPVIAGLIFAVADGENYEFWTRAFLKGRMIEKMLDLAVAQQVKDLRKRLGQIVDYSA